jgi:dynein heavy chain
VASAEDLLKKLPPAWVKDQVKEAIQKIDHRKPLNIFCAQEIDRLQVVIVLVRRTLQDLKLAVGGIIIMSSDLQEALDSLFDSRVPPRWVKVSWPSPNMGLWFSDVIKRHEQLNDWLIHDRPAKYWLTGFFNPQGFLTSVRQEVCRSHAKEGWSLDEMEAKTDVLKMEKHECDRGPPEGVYIYGLFLEGCSWDKNRVRVKEAAPKEMFRELPILHVTGQEAGHRQPKQKGALNKFKCPCYKYPSRNDINWIFDVELNCEEEPSHWILRGCCLLCTVD